MRANREVSEIDNRNIFCGRSKPDRLFNMPHAHYHEHYEIYYLLRGKREYFIENQVYKVSAGDIVFIPKGILHKTVARDNSAHQRLLLSFDDRMLSPAHMEEIGRCFSRYHYHIPKALSGRLEMLLFKIEEEYKRNDPFSRQIMKGCLLELFAFFTREAGRFSAPQGVAPRDRDVQEIVVYLGENYNAEITLGGVARQFCVSAEHLSRKFKRVTGFHFSEYLTLIRIQQAEKLLLNGALSITEIAAQTGFNDGNYFSSVFKKIKGVPPRKYRKSAEAGPFKVRDLRR